MLLLEDEEKVGEKAKDIVGEGEGNRYEGSTEFLHVSKPYLYTHPGVRNERASAAAESV